MPATRGHRAFSPSPPPVQPFNPADEGTPPRARRHQRRRDEELHKSHTPSSRGNANQLKTSAAASLSSVLGTSPRLPLKEKNAEPSRNVSINDRDGGSTGNKASITAPTTRSTRASSRPASTAKIMSGKPLAPRLAQPISAAQTEKVSEKQTSTRASTVKAKPTTETSKKPEHPSSTKSPIQTNTHSSKGNTIVEVVIDSPAKKDSPAASTDKKKQKAGPVSESREKDNDEDEQPEVKLALEKKGTKLAAKKADPPKKDVAPKAPPKKSAKKGAAKKSATLTSENRSEKEPAQDHPSPTTASKVSQPQDRAQVNIAKDAVPDQDTKVEKMSPAEQEEQSPAQDEGPLFLDAMNDDAPPLPLDIPPSSPGRFVGWHKAAHSTSEDDLEYFEPDQFSDHRQHMDQLGQKGRVSVGRLGAKEGLALSGGGQDLPKDAVVVSAAAGAASAVAPMPMQSTPLSHKTTGQTSNLQPADTPRTALRKAKDRERMMGLEDSDEDSNDDPVIEKVNMVSSDKVTGRKPARKGGKIVVPKIEKTEQPMPDEAVKSVKMEAAPDTKAKVLPRPKGSKSRETSALEKQTVVAVMQPEKADSDLAIKDATNARFEPGEEDDDDAADLFGFAKSQRDVKELLTKKAMLKKSAHVQPVKEIMEVESLTQNEDSTPGEFSKNALKPLAAAADDREESLPPINPAALKKITQQKKTDVSAVEKNSIAAQFSSDLTALDSDLEDDIQEKVIKAQKRGKAKAIEPEERVLTMDEIAALGQGNDEVLEKIKAKPTQKGGRKSTAKGRKLQLEDEEGDDSKQKKKKVLKLTQDSAALAPTKPRASAKKKIIEAEDVELDEFDVPPGMTSADITSSRVTKKGKSQVKKAEPIKATSAVEKNSKGQPRPRPRAAMAPRQDNQDEEWDEPPAAKGAPSKKTAKGKASSAVREQTEDPDTQPIITPASRKSLKRSRLAIDDEEEDENPKAATRRKIDTSYYDSLKDFQLAVETVL